MDRVPEKALRSNLAPDWRESKLGYKFDANSNKWVLDGSIAINLEPLAMLVEPVTLKGVRRALCRYGEELASSTTSSVLVDILSYFRETKERKFTVAGIANYKALGGNFELRVGRIRGFLYALYDWGFDGVDARLIYFLEELTIKGGPKGQAVKGRCPHSGPLTAIEQGALIEWASNAFNTKVISLKEFSLLLAMMYTGRRPAQIRYLQTSDLVASESKNGESYVLNVPRAKQGGKYREYFRAVPITDDLYLLLENLAASVCKMIGNHLGEAVPSQVRAKLPIFFQDSRLVEILDIESLENRLEKTPDYFCMTSSSVSLMVQQLSQKNQARSERTGEYIQFSPRRFRYTKGTNLAGRGISGVALGYALDHVDVQNVNVYTKNTSEAAKIIDEIMSPVMAPLAQAFVGTLLDSELQALRAGDPNSRVKSSDQISLGNCGTHEFCASGYRACYTCINFQPWRDAPHHEVREEILSERKRQQELGVSQSVIASTDRLLLAVEQVIALCSQVSEAG